MEYIKGYEGLYSVTKDGKIYSHIKKRFLKQSIKNGYTSVNLYKNKKYKTYRVHRLVAETYIPNLNNYPQVNHKDENRSNNSVENLEWCTSSYNINYGNRNKNFSQCIRCLETNRIYPSQNAIARDLGVAQGCVSYAIKNNKSVLGYTLEVVSNVN